MFVSVYSVVIFVCSSFCLFEFETALHHWISMKRTRRLIVLMTLNSPIDLYVDEESGTAVLRQYVRQYTYIDYTDDWLDRLLYALPMRGMDAAAADNNADDLDDDNLIH